MLFDAMQFLYPFICLFEYIQISLWCFTLIFDQNDSFVSSIDVQCKMKMYNHFAGLLKSEETSRTSFVILALFNRLRNGTVRFLAAFFTLPSLLPSRKAWMMASGL